MNKIANIVAYRYSLHPPEFYRFKGTLEPRGLGCGPIAEDAGLWNLAWLSKEKTFQSYEEGEDEKNLSMWSGAGLEYIAQLGGTMVNGEKLRVVATKMKAVDLVNMLSQSPPKTPGPYENVKWEPWIAFAMYRAQASKNALVDAAEFNPVKSYAILVEEARQAEFHVRALPKPELPIFPKPKRSKQRSIEACLTERIRNASSQGANSNV